MLGLLNNFDIFNLNKLSSEKIRYGFYPLFQRPLRPKAREMSSIECRNNQPPRPVVHPSQPFSPFLIPICVPLLFVRMVYRFLPPFGPSKKNEEKRPVCLCPLYRGPRNGIFPHDLAGAVTRNAVSPKTLAGSFQRQSWHGSVLKSK